MGKGSYPFSLREKAGMRGGNTIKALAFLIPSPQPSPGGRGGFYDTLLRERVIVDGHD